ncbi:MAG TPA: ABC transporter permease [Vicinamibacterales bacterium]|nr:ABC transporter permease [Vicinamibacterales bacterium]
MSPARRWSFADRIFRALVRLFPFDFRADHGRDLEQTLRAQHRDARRQGSLRAIVTLWLDIARDVVTTALREHVAILKQDVGYALRALRRAPVFAASAVLTLAIGMSAMTGMIAVLNAVMFRPLPVDRPEQIISISNRTGEGFRVSFLDLQDYRARTKVLADAVGYAPRIAALTADGRSERIMALMVTDNYFAMLGVRPAAGRLIQPNEGRAAGDAPVLVLDYQYWRTRFAGDPSVVGRTVRIGAQPFTVIGVTEPVFRGTESLMRMSAYVPAWMNEAFSDTPASSAPSIFVDRAVRPFTVLARLKPGVSLAQARADLDVAAAALARAYPLTHKDLALRVVPETHTRPTPVLGSFLRTASTALAGLAVVVLMITSANVANLLMARAASRGREVALRAALGARRGRIMRQFLTEGVTLALLGGLVALPVVVVAMRGLQEIFTGVSAIIDISPDFSIDGGVVAIAFLMSIGAGVVAGLAPALLAGRSDPGGSLKTGGRGAAGGSGSLTRSGLVVAQVALSLTLLVSGGLFVRSLHHARAVDLGFNPDGLFVASVSPGIHGYDTAQRLAFYERIATSVAALPGIDHVGWTSLLPMSVITQNASVVPDVRPADPDWQPPSAFRFDVSPMYFTAVGVPILEGRTFSERDDANGTPVVIVNETLARLFWPNQSPLGRHLTAYGTAREVVGVVGNGKYLNVGESPQPAIFNPLAQTAPSLATVIVRTSRSPVELASTIRQTITRVDPGVTLFDVRSMTTHLDNGSGFFPIRLGAFMTTLFGGLGMLLASIGLYGMIAYHVSQRTQEIGLRMALGARAADIIRGVLAQGGRFAIVGIAIGLVLAAVIARLLKGLLLGVSPFDPLTYGAVAGLLVAICLLASFVPARRATSVDPLIALRAE